MLVGIKLRVVEVKEMESEDKALALEVKRALESVGEENELAILSFLCSFGAFLSSKF